MSEPTKIDRNHCTRTLLPPDGSKEHQPPAAQPLAEGQEAKTYAAWVRTGLLALAGGMGARALKDVPDWLVLANGTLLIAFSLFCFGAGVWRHFHPGPSPPEPSVKVMPRAALVMANAVLSMIAVGALVVLWWMPR